jgi:IclR family acetate operon transcriptional repressor
MKREESAQVDDAGPRPAQAGPSRTIQSVDRALDVLEALAESGEELPLREVAARTDLNVSTCHHLLATLVKRGYAGRSRLGRLYFIGNKVLELSNRRFSQFNIVEMAMPELRRLNQEIDEVVYLSAMQGYELVTLAKLDSSHPIQVRAKPTSESTAAHATATGKAILAWLPEVEIAKVIAENGLRRYTDRTITNIEDLMEELRHVRRNGYASDNEEFQPGVVCVGSAVRDHHGAVIAAVSSSVPEMRATGELVEKIRAAVRSCARELSVQLGSPE